MGLNVQHSLFLQVIRELVELNLKYMEDCFITEIIACYQNERFGEVVEWKREAENFLGETKPEVDDHENQMDPSWCLNILYRLRKIRAKRGSDSIYQIVSDLRSSSINMAPLSLREKFYCEITSLVNIYYAMRNIVPQLHNGHPLNKFCGNTAKQLIKEVDKFLAVIRLHLHQKIPETNSDWYCNKIAETRGLIDKWEPEFSLQSQEVGSSSINMPTMPQFSLHEELRCEIRLLTNIQCVNALVYMNIMDVQDQRLQYKCFAELTALVSEMKKFIIETKLQIVEKIPGKNSNWYRNKKAESRRLIAKCYSTFPLRAQDVGYANEQFHIFLSFRGEDTRYSFTRNLYDALRQEGFKVFMDDEGMKIGDSISQVLVEEIENSKLSIIVFSQNFADSSWCLDEVVKILECKQKNGQQVWPIFYKVQPTDVRRQKNSYAVSMSQQEKKLGKDSEIVKKWKSSLYEVAGLKAFPYNGDRYESDFIKDIIKEVKNIKF